MYTFVMVVINICVCVCVICSSEDSEPKFYYVDLQNLCAKRYVITLIITTNSHYCPNASQQPFLIMHHNKCVHVAKYT